ncbi:hypothetical protein A2865_00215 [Candidatus Woesebacteria bacterium RIFCSPHIGHO2_01_FULL_39_17]|uniref:Uncharacterized protein n=3 Tax=Candidatus Woeseibacteriota TaxID=1752722 RepID=A0A0G0NDQ3_9BACT|nr:MAG: hypothetical protein US72_C0005G0015 [Microgenomates group bacterium GW2011_GWC1_38_12]KKQ94210.1 MAG: hypothetical protein UT19_C0003G0015 [Candidatus Woesebacteria bacterium GW2011_GWB1_39_10b]KKR14274.1 MAG: hypothetical protein UT40_C0003G0016 [Candidatus Woesebacteria bacterium GW2011_GWA1_39_21b]OGM23656.1 MAG: hypothetical protein A2865_00215 [Candidatus Woesebacteria bacterium RIFCSPHIGHO2_01_FULL_39_17]OGM65478.1 MAG: hypothetical protein A3A52_00955 [Candidatus Woesebacteria b
MKNVKGAIDHLKTHQSYPATKEELLAECDNLSDFSDEDKEWFKANLPEEPEGGFKSADEVIKALSLSEE